MKIAVVGAGAIGGFLGVRLSLAGHDVTFIARNRNLATISRNGFRLIEADGRGQHAAAARAVADGAEAGAQDFVLLTVKAHQVRDVLAPVQGLLGPETAVVTMINGLPWWYFQRQPGPYENRTLESVDPGGTIAAAIGAERVIGSVVYPATELVEPGLVRVIEGNRFTLGEPDGSRSPRIEALSQAMMGAGFKAPVTKDIRAEIWLKLWGNVSFNPVSALTHATLEGICRDPGGRAAVEAMMKEAQAVADKLGVAFKISIEQRIAGAEAVGAHKTSMLQDVEQGRALELEALVGSVVELGRITGTPTPAIDAVYGIAGLLARTLAASKSRLAPSPA
jgi:2-dehydropantoate 2-reductase